MRPLYFGPEERPLFGWLHEPAAPPRLGLVVCNPYGYEAICSHRSLRHFCDEAAAAGVLALRFDYDGTGDSAGDDREAGRLPAWVASVERAIEAVRAHGVDQVALLGVRLGALVAALAAERRGDVAGLIAIAPVVRGQPWLRELRALQMALNRPPTPPGVVDEAGVREVHGFALTAETEAAIAAVDLARSERPPAPAVLLLERDDLPGNDAWPAHLAKLGVALERVRAPGYAQMMLGAQDAQVPTVMVDAATRWLQKAAAAIPAPPAASATTAPAGEPATEAQTHPKTEAKTEAQIDGVVERAVFVSPEIPLFGVVSEAPTPPRRRRAILLLNAGAIHHIGPNRLYVPLARRWARLGHLVLRLDIAGVGDSPPRNGEPENVVYSEHFVEDVRAAVAYLRAQPGVAEVQALGLCSGGYHAFKAAVAGIELDGVTLINPLTFFYKQGMSFEIPPYEATGETQRYAQRARSLEAWMKVLRGEVDIGYAARVVGRRLFYLSRDRGRAVLRRFGVVLGDDLEHELELVARRGGAVRFLFAGDDPGRSLLREQGGGTVERLQRRGRLSIDLVAGADHTFTPLWSHDLLIGALARALD